MNLGNLTYYVSKGAILGNSTKQYRNNSLGPLLLTILVGSVPGIVLLGYWIYLSFLMLLLGLVCIFTVYMISKKTLSLKRCLVLDTIIFGTWILELSIIEFMYLSMWQGINLLIGLIFIPTFILPVSAALKTHKALKKPVYNSKTISNNNIRTIGFLSGLLGMNFAAIFRDVDQGIAFIIIMLCFSILNGLMSLGLQSLQKLYYIQKFQLSV